MEMHPMRYLRRAVVLFALALLIFPITGMAQKKGAPAEVKELEMKTKRFAPTVVTADASKLSTFMA